MPEEYIQMDGFQLHTMWNDMDFGGSALVGSVDATLEELEEYLGKPMNVNGTRIDKRWLLKFDDGIIATLFNYQGQTQIRVGGFREISKERIEEWLTQCRA